MAETPRRFVRIPDAIWESAERKAKAHNTDMSKVIRALLTEWAADEPVPRITL